MTTRQFPEPLASVTDLAHLVSIIKKERASRNLTVAPSLLSSGKQSDHNRHSHGSGLEFSVALLQAHTPNYLISTVFKQER